MKNNLALKSDRPDTWIQVDPVNNLWEAHAWKLSFKTAGSLLGGIISGHVKQKLPSWISGRIVGFRQSSLEPDRLIILFERDDAIIDGSQLKWGWEKAYH